MSMKQLETFMSRVQSNDNIRAEVQRCGKDNSCVVKVAARHGIRVIALTDATGSPLADHAVHRFAVPNHSLFYSNSMCAFMLLAEGLLSEVASVLGEPGLTSLKRREQLINELNHSL